MDHTYVAATALQGGPQTVTASHGTLYRLFDVHFADGTAKHTLVPINLQNCIVTHPTTFTNAYQLKVATQDTDSKMGVTIGNDAGPASTIKFVMNPAYNCILNEQNVHSKFKRLSSSSHVRICSSNPSDFQELQWPLENNVNEVRIIEQIPFTKEDKLNPENITILVDPHSYIYPEDELESTDCADCPSLRTLLERPCHVTSKGSVKKRLTTSSDRLTNGSECDNVNINTKKSTYSGMKPRKDTNSTTEVNDSGPSKSSWILDMKTKLSTLAAENFGKSQNGASSTSRNMKLNNQLTIEGRTIKSNRGRKKKVKISESQVPSVLKKFNAGTLFDLLKTPTQNVLSNVSKEGYDGNTKKQLTKKKKRKKDIKNDSSVKIERHLESTVIRDCSVLLRRIHPSYLRNTYINLQKISEKKLFKSVGIRKRSIVKVYNRQRKGKPNHSNESNPAKKFNITKTIDDCISPVKKPRKRRRKTVSRSPNKKLKPANSSISISTDASDINTSKTTCCTTEQSINRNNGNMGASGEISQSYADLEHNVEASCKETCPDVILL